MEHGADRSHDLLQGIGCKHPGTLGSAREVRKQNSNSYQDRSQLENALKIPTGRFLHAEGTWWIGNVVYGSRFDPSKRFAMVETD